MKTIQKALLTLLLAVPFLLLLLPGNYFDTGQSLCPSKVLLDIECPGCGLTRGVMHLMHFDFADAWHFNKLSYPILVLGVLVWLHLLGILIHKPIFPWLKRFY
ncbi:MAG: DUF2752 domain-containing protein [Bacteroidia bacterium]|nr:DUF2752 domain-containing protein [Bacteroidia bacterium]MCO5253594.1 DUF2752 domain-containing protein [Bacteroidota bacterium]